MCASRGHSRHSCFAAHIPPIPERVPPRVSRRPVSAHRLLPVCDKKIKGLRAQSLENLGQRSDWILFGPSSDALPKLKRPLPPTTEAGVVSLVGWRAYLLLFLPNLSVQGQGGHLVLFRLLPSGVRASEPSVGASQPKRSDSPVGLFVTFVRHEREQSDVRSASPTPRRSLPLESLLPRKPFVDGEHQTASQSGPGRLLSSSVVQRAFNRRAGHFLLHNLSLHSIYVARFIFEIMNK